MKRVLIIAVPSLALAAFVLFFVVPQLKSSYERAELFEEQRRDAASIVRVELPMTALVMTQDLKTVEIGCVVRGSSVPNGPFGTPSDLRVAEIEMSLRVMLRELLAQSPVEYFVSGAGPQLQPLHVLGEQAADGLTDNLLHRLASPQVEIAWIAYRSADGALCVIRDERVKNGPSVPTGVRG